MKQLMVISCVLLLVGVTGVVHGDIVNINARTNTTTNPVVISFDAGTYDVVPIGISDGGAFNAWNAWSGGPNPPSKAGWLNSYR